MLSLKESRKVESESVQDIKFGDSSENRYLLISNKVDFGQKCFTKIGML